MAVEETKLLQESSRKRDTSSSNPEKTITLPKTKKKSSSSKTKKPTACCARHTQVDLSNRDEGICHRLSVVMVLSLMVLLLLLLSLYKSVQPDEAKSLEQIREDVGIDIAQLKRKTLQDQHFWREVDAALHSILSDDVSSKSAFVLLATPIGTEKAATCLSHHISDIVYHAFQDTRIPVVHDTRKFLSLTPSDHKLALDNELKGLNSSHSAIIYNLELMPAETATLLHGYCDNDNAPFKRVIFLMTLELDLHRESISPEYLHLVVERRLLKKWNDYNLLSFISSLANHTAFVTNNADYVMDKLCPL